MIKKLCQSINLIKLLIEILAIIRTLSIVILVLGLILQSFWRNNLSNYDSLVGDIYEKIVIVASYITDVLLGSVFH